VKLVLKMSNLTYFDDPTCVQHVMLQVFTVLYTQTCLVQEHCLQQPGVILLSVEAVVDGQLVACM